MKYTPSGIAVTNFTLAVNRAFTNQQGERDADFIRVRAWRKQAENVANYLQKGSLCGIDGRIETGAFEGNDGKRVYTFDVIADSVQFLEPKAKDESQGAAPPPHGQGEGPYHAPSQQPYQQNQQAGYGHYNTDPNAYGPGR